MMAVEPFDEAIAAAQLLAQKMDDLGQKVGALGTYGRRNRHLIRALVVSFVLDILLTVGLGFSSVEAHDASNKANLISKQNALTLKTTCEAGNDTRGVLRQFFVTIFAIPSGTIPTPAQVSEDQKILALSNATFNTRPC